MATTELGIRLTVDGASQAAGAINGVEKSLDGLNNAADKISDKPGKGLRNIGESAKGAVDGVDSLRAALAGVVSVGAAVAIIKMADSVTSLQTALKLSSDSARSAAVAYEQLYGIAQRTRTNFAELGTTYAAIARAGNELGISQSRLLKVTESIGSAMTISGGSAASMQAALMQLGQGLSSGVLRGEELNSIMEQTPRLAQAIAEGFGVSVGQLRALGEQGKLTSAEVIRALEKVGPQLSKEIGDATLTVGQAFTQLTNSVTKFIGEADKASGATDSIAKGIKGLSNVVDSVGESIKANPEIANFAIKLAAGAAGIGVTTTAVWGLTAAVTALGAAAKANPIILTLSLIGGATVAVSAAVDSYQKSATGMQAAIDKFDKANEKLAHNRKLIQDNPNNPDKRFWETTVKDIERLIPTLEREANKAREALGKLKSGSISGGVGSGDAALSRAQTEEEKRKLLDGAQSLDEVKKFAKTRLDILEEYKDKEQKLIASYRQAASKTTDESEIKRLASDEADRLKVLNAAKMKELKSFDDASSKAGRNSAKEQTKAAQDASKLQLKQTISDFERAQKASEEYFKNQEEDAKSAYDRGLMDYEQYVKRKEAISLASNEYGTQIASGELSAVQRSGIAQKDKISQENKYLAELEGLAAKRANISQKAANDIQEAEDKAAKAAAKASDAQNQKMKESVDEYIAESARKKAADQELQAARAAMEGKPAEVIAGIEAGMAVRAQAAKQLDDMRKAYAKAAEEAQNYADGIEMIKEHGGIVSPSEQKELERLVKNVRAAGTELGRLGDAVDTNEIDAKARASAASIKAQTDKLAGEINTKLADAILSAGVDGGAGLRKAIEDILITRPFRIVVEAALKPISEAIAQGILGQGVGGGIGEATGLSSVLNTAALAVSTFGKSAASSAVDIVTGGASFVGAMETAGKMAGEGNYAAAAGKAAPYVLAAVAAAKVIETLSTIKVSPAGTFLYGGSGYDDTESGFKWGGRRDFMQEGGFRGSNKNSEWFEPEKAVSDYLTATGTAITTSVKDWAGAIGLSADAVDDYKGQIELALDGIDPKGVTAAIDKTMAAFGESMTQATYGLSVDTLKNLATNLQGVNTVFEAVGMTALDASMGSAELATNIVDAAGGMDNLGKLTSAMYSAIATPAQKAADEAAKLDKAFAALGVSTPKTVQDLAKLAQAQDLTSDAGRKAAVGILSLLPALQQVQDGAKATRDAMLKDVGVEQGDISAIVKKGLIEGNLKDAGGQISEVVMTGIQNALYGKLADAITGSFTNEMLAPLLEAMQKGKSLPEALAAVDWTQVKSKFQQTVDDISAIFNNTQVTSGIGALKGAIQDIFSTASYSIPKGWILTKDDATKAATGGLITGPGTGTSDSIPAMLSNGEFVVNAKSAAKLGTGFLNAINAGEMPTTVNRASGGMVWDDPAEYQDWLALSGAGNTSTTANSGYYENGFVADSRNAPGATKAAADYAALDTDAAQTYIDVLRAMGEVYSANTLALENATEGFDALHVAMYREIEAGKTLVSMRETLAQSEKGAAQLGVDLLTAQGDTTGAASAQRTLDLLDVTAQRTAAASRLLDEGLSENEKSYQTAIVATADATIASYDLTKAREAEITAIETVKSALDEGKDTFAQFDIDISRQLGLDALADDLQKASDMKDVIKAVADAQNKLDTIGDSLSDADKAAQKYIVTTGTMALKEYDLNKARQVALDGLTLTKGKLEDLGNADISLGIAKANATGDTQTAYGLQKALDLADVTKAVNAAQTQLDKYGDTLDATAKAALQTTITNGKLISSQYDLNKARDGEITALQRLKSAAATYDTTTVSWLRAKGDDKGADAAQRGIDLKDVLDSTALATARLADATDIGEITTLKATIATNAQTESLYDLNKERQKETELLNEIKNRQESAAETGRTTYIEMLKATGQSAKAAALELEKATEGFDAAHIAIVRQTNANKALIQSAKGLESTGDSVTASRIGLLTAQGDKTGAAALQRELDIRPYVTAIADATRDLGTATTDTEKGILNTVIANNKQSISNYDLAKSLDAEAEAASAAQEAANALAQSYEDLKNQIAQANIDLAKASGLDSYAEDLQAALALRDHAGDAYYESLYRELLTIQKLTEARNQLNGLEETAVQKQIALKRASGSFGDKVLANGLEREAALKSLTAPAVSAKAELDRSNMNFGQFVSAKGLSTNLYDLLISQGADPKSLTDQSVMAGAYYNPAKDPTTLAALSSNASGHDTNLDAISSTGILPGALVKLFAEYRGAVRTTEQKSTLQSVVDTASGIAAAYDKNKALEAELKIIELQDEAYKQSLDAQKSLADAQKAYADVLKSTINTMRDFLSTLDGAASPLQNLSTSRANFQAIAGRAASGDTSAYKDLTPAAKTFLDLSKNYSKSIVDYQRDEAKVRATLNAVINVNQRELDKLPQEIAAVADPTKDAWLKLQEATAKEAETSIMLTALGVDSAASKQRLRAAEETLGERYIEQVYLLEETKKTSLLDAFTTAVNTKVSGVTLPTFDMTFNLAGIWSTEIAKVLPYKMTNDDWNKLIAEKFPGLLKSDLVVPMTPDVLTGLIRGVMPPQLTVDNLVSSTADVSGLVGTQVSTVLTASSLVSSTADVAGLVGTQIATILPSDFAGVKFDAKLMMQTAINNAMTGLTGLTGTGGTGTVKPPDVPIGDPPPTVIDPPKVTDVTGPGTGATLPSASWYEGIFDRYGAGQERTGTLQEYLATAHSSGRGGWLWSSAAYAASIGKTTSDLITAMRTAGLNGWGDMTVAELQNRHLSSVGIPAFATGTNRVTHDTLAFVHKDEAIIPAPFNPAKYGRDSGNTALVEKIQELTAKVEVLTQKLEAGQNAIAANTGKATRLLAKFDIDGIETRT